MWDPSVRYRIFYTKAHYINFEAHEFICNMPMAFSDFEDFDIKDLAEVQKLTLGHYGYQPVHPITNIPLNILGMLALMPGLKEIKIVVRNWCAQVGVNQGIGQELFRKEVQETWRTFFEQALKDARMEIKLRIMFKDWNDGDTPPCSADAAKGPGWRYFSPIANANNYDA
jgi:hypothetical protein